MTYVGVRDVTIKMSLELIQTKNREILDIIEKRPEVLQTVYEKIGLDKNQFVEIDYTGVPSIVMKGANTIYETLDMSLALVQTVTVFILDNPSNPDNDRLCLCINTICDEINLLRSRII